MGNRMRLQQKISFIHGFTMVELALVFLIAGFFFFIVGSTASSRIEAERMKVSRQRLGIIMKATEQYVKTYHPLPCPADPWLSVDDANFGDGAGTNTGNAATDANCTASHLQRNTSPSNTAPRGAVPVKQLSLNPRAA